MLDQLDVAVEAKAEIEAEAKRFRENPTSLARRFDRERTIQAIQKAADPASLEACAHPQVRSLLLELDFGRVVQVAASWDPAFAAKLLDVIGNAALVAAVIRGSGVINIRTKANLLRSVGPVFDVQDRWTGGPAAWMILLEIEDGLREPLQQQIRAVQLGLDRPPDPEAIVIKEMNVAVEALLSRPDGPRLALEWLAHMLWSVIIEPIPFQKSAEEDFSALDPAQVLLKVLSARYRREEWASPIRIWTLLGGSLLETRADGSHRPAQSVPLLLPQWRDWLGQRNTLVPISVAVQLYHGTTVPPDWLVAWVRLVCKDLEGLPAVYHTLGVID